MVLDSLFWRLKSKQQMIGLTADSSVGFGGFDGENINQ